MKISFIATVFNEAENIEKLLHSISNQTRMPDEVIICDGKSTDNTFSKIANFELKSKDKIIKILLLNKKGNRSVGRNAAIKKATGDIIVCSDAGCILDKDYIKNITRPFKSSKVDVVAGYYKGLSSSTFQKCLVPYVFVMPDRVNPDRFLPAARSIAFKKDIWENVGGFPEEYSNNEDYIFAKRLKKVNARIVFERNAIVNWIPRKSLKEAFVMFYRFALGDSEAGIFRPKVSIIFIRYLFGFSFLIYAIIRSNQYVYAFLAVMVIAYLVWSVFKNYKYVKEYWAIVILPVLQIISDIAILIGTVIGISKLWDIRKRQ